MTDFSDFAKKPEASEVMINRAKAAFNRADEGADYQVFFTAVKAYVDERITDESNPIAKAIDEMVLAGQGTGMEDVD